jgi:hypothetical protein
MSNDCPQPHPCRPLSRSRACSAAVVAIKDGIDTRELPHMNVRFLILALFLGFVVACVNVGLQQIAPAGWWGN